MDNPDPHSNWKRMRFKRNKVWVAVDEQGRPVVEKSKVLIKYQLDQEHQYWVYLNSLHPLEETAPSSEKIPAAAHGPVSGTDETDTAIAPETLNKAIRIHTDGACSGNPGPAGIGVVLQYRQHRKEISRYIGEATNNIAEMEAIRTGLQSVKNRNLPVVVFTDSSYALGVLVKGWKAKENPSLIGHIKALIAKFQKLRIVKIKGHAGHPENERADQLAVEAVQSGKKEMDA
jgi:ribonuclease HI